MFSYEPNFELARSRMVEEQLRRRGIHDSRVLEAMATMPRHEFINAEHRHRAYDDEPVEVGEGQTISQPLMVAIMLQALQLTADAHVLEIGTGTGYQAALLAKLAKSVVTVERIASLAARARENLGRLGLDNVKVVESDGTSGFPELAPYDRIIVAAAAPAAPRPLLDQLADEGILLLPIGDSYSQVLTRVRRRGDEYLHGSRDHCRFVPLIGRWGFAE